MVTLIAPVPVLKQVANRFEQWQYAEQAFLFGMDFIKHGNASIADKTLVAGNYPSLFPFATSFARQLCEALELAVLLERFPQFDITTPRYVFDSVTFFMERGERLHCATFFQGDENAERIERTVTYTDSRNDKRYEVKGIAIESGARFYCWQHLDGAVIGRHEWLKAKINNPIFNWITDINTALFDALDKAQTRMLVEAGLIT